MFNILIIFLLELTLIIDDSTMLGLSQMYQIRGRIGRSKVQAYAYFYYESLKGDSKLRLEALKNSQELGSGFLLSNKDLEIRGAGDILGMNQSVFCIHYFPDQLVLPLIL